MENVNGDANSSSNTSKFVSSFKTQTASGQNPYRKFVDHHDGQQNEHAHISSRSPIEMESRQSSRASNLNVNLKRETQQILSQAARDAQMQLRNSSKTEISGQASSQKEQLLHLQQQFGGF